MSALNKKEKIKKIQQICSENNITAYNIAQNTTITEAGIGRILADKVKNPHDSTINEIYNYIVNSKTFTHSEDPEYIIPKPELQHHHENLLKEVNLLLIKLENVKNPNLKDLQNIKDAIQLKKEIQLELNALLLL
mgnify:CR=1 FL=1